MEIVLGVWMAPAVVRMVLVEGAGGDGVTLDTETFEATGAGSDGVARVVAAIVGTRDSAVDDGYRLGSVGVAWSDHDDAARLRQELRTHRVDDVVLVSELHAAGALAQAVGRRTGCGRVALLFLERDQATLAVVRTADGAVVGVRTRSVAGCDAAGELQQLVAGLGDAAEPPEAVFLVGSELQTGVDMGALSGAVASQTAVPVYAPADAEVALARGAALAAASVPGLEALTVGLVPADEALTAAGVTRLGDLAPLGYSAVPDDDEPEGQPLFVPEADELPGPDQKPFLLIGSALASIFVVGVVALAISLAVSIRPAVEQRPGPQQSAAVTGAPAPPAAPAAETIRAPVPVVREAAPTVVVPRAGTAAPQDLPAPVAAAVPPPPADIAAPPPPPAAVPATPAPAQPIVIAPIPVLPRLLPPMMRTPPWPPVVSPPAQTPTAPPAPAVPSYTAPAPAPQSDPAATSAGTGEPVPPVSSQSPLWPLWPGAGRSSRQ